MDRILRPFLSHLPEPQLSFVEELKVFLTEAIASVDLLRRTLDVVVSQSSGTGLLLPDTGITLVFIDDTPPLFRRRSRLLTLGLNEMTCEFGVLKHLLHLWEPLILPLQDFEEEAGVVGRGAGSEGLLSNRHRRHRSEGERFKDCLLDVFLKQSFKF